MHTLINDIKKFKSLSIVGLEKNTGKTECLKYILNKFKDSDHTIALTSIGIDGESVDQVKNTHKPEIELYNGDIFVTSEKHYRQRRLVAEILNVSEEQTSLGRLITARVRNRGKVLISGPAHTKGIKSVINQMDSYNVNTTLIDGALSRLSLGSPAVAEGIILSTGAAVSNNIPQLVKKTKFVYDLINLELFDSPLKEELIKIQSGIWAVDADETIHNLNIPSVFMLDKNRDKIFAYGSTIFASGAISDKLLEFLRVQKNAKDIVLIIKDFTKIFVTPQVLNAFLRKGGQIKVLMKTNLLAITINPVSPQGFNLDSDILKQKIQNVIDIPVYDIKRL